MWSLLFKRPLASAVARRMPKQRLFYANYSQRTTRRTRRISPDNVSAVVSWLLMSHALWITLSTTTFVSGVVYLLSSTDRGQQWLTKRLSNYLTKSTGVTVLFDHNTHWSHNWGRGTIQCHNLYMSRRPCPLDSRITTHSIWQRVKWAINDNVLVQMDHFQDGDYTQFDLTVESCELSLSFNKWLNGRGILESVAIQGVRGVIDRTHLKPVITQPNQPRTPMRYVRKPGDFEIGKVKVTDLLVTLYQPNGFRPFQISIVNCILPQLRKQWLLHDILCGDTINGTFDDSMFILQKKQQLQLSHFRIDHLNIDHLNSGTVGPFGWISRGFIDIQTNIHYPSTNKALQFDIDLQLKHVRAEIPFFNNEFMTFRNKTLVKPIVGYINSHRTYIPIQCSLEKPLEDFNGSWTVYDSNLVQDLSWKCWDSFEMYVMDQEQKSLRIKKVAFWSVQVFLQALLMALGSISQ